MSRVNGGHRQPEPMLFETESRGPFASVVFNRPLDQEFTYAIPEHLRRRVVPGQRIRVPLGRGNELITGYCVRVDETSSLPPDRIKDVVETIDDPPLIDASMLELTRWMALYYVCSWGQALDAAVPAGVKKQAGQRIQTFLTVPSDVIASTDLPALATKQSDAFAAVKNSSIPLSIADACRLAKCQPATIQALRKKGLLHTVRRRTSRIILPGYEEAIDPNDPDGDAPIALTSEQTDVLDQLIPALNGDSFAPFLLHGVTGSGKTEIYLSAIERVVARDREAIVLVPEISLTPQTIRRFRRRFPRVAVLHSQLSDVERHRHWRSIADGEIQVVVGARSAVFAPARRLGLIVVDEEHETTFKQEETPRYHARDVAVKRAQLLGIPVMLGSATPSLESWHNAERGKYTRLTIARRVEDRPMPEVTLIDLRTEKPPRGGVPTVLCATLREAMNEALGEGGQVMLLLNRRGYHTFILCPKCGHIAKCKACDVSLTFHRERRLAICHQCDAEHKPPDVCKACGYSRLHFGGVGTERLEREVKETFPGRVIRRMDGDTMRAGGGYEEVLGDFRSGKVEILLGTQMIAKGLDFPNVTLVGVVSADTALHLPDFRAAERTFQLLAQVAGRTGRGDRAGRVIVQTYTPEAAAVSRAVDHDYLGFVADELPHREASGYPPFARMARIVARGPVEQVVDEYLGRLANALVAAAPPGVRVIGPAPAPLTKIKHMFRYHLQLRSMAPGVLQDLLRAVVPNVQVPAKVEVAVDVDSISQL
jgi:primosomal protein N' (replication factor Y) (superfamily II helicase)